MGETIRLQPTEMVVEEPQFAAAVRHELFVARRQHRGIHSLHEGYAVILEEVRKLEREVFDRTKPTHRIIKELIQVGAMCQRFAEDLNLHQEVAERLVDLQLKCTQEGNS